MSRIFKGLLLAVLVLVGLLAILLVAKTPNPLKQDESAKPVLTDYQRPPANPLNNAYFGELHLHTSFSLDANLFASMAENGPRTAYRFALGEEVQLPGSTLRQRLKVPLDFAAVTDHAEGFGLMEQCNNPQSQTYHSITCYSLRFKLKVMFRQVVASVKQEGNKTGSYLSGPCGESGVYCKTSAKDMWQEIQSAANDYYQPGRFTTFIGYEYSPTLNQSGMLHRNVIFRGTQVPDTAFSALDGFAEDLLRWLEKNCQGECQAMAIPHNPNWSWGLMYGELNSDATPVTRENLLLRAKYESLVELFQVKGNSECALGLGGNDEECGFENLWPVCSAEQAQIDPALGQHAPRCVSLNDTFRQVLKKGLQDQQKWGFNPFKLGFIGATDNHNGMPGDTEEDTWKGHGGEPDSTPGFRLGYESNMVADTLGFSLLKLNPGGLAGVWAPENTREAIFDAMQRKETFATSGTRVKVRLFAGFGLPANLHERPDALQVAYAQGVPMGGDLPAAVDDQSPVFLVQAMRDVHSAPLQKIQIVKGWLADGQTREQVYDVVCSDGLQPDTVTHRCPDNGARVNLADCSISADKGAAELAATWTDPQFSPQQSAFYYARVLENPVCRWSQYDALALGKPHPAGESPTVRERAWSSPVWYNSPGI